MNAKVNVWANQNNLVVQNRGVDAPAPERKKHCKCAHLERAFTPVSSPGCIQCRETTRWRSAWRGRMIELRDLREK